MESSEDLRRNADLGLTTEVETVYKPVMVDGDKVMTYSRFYNEEGEEETDLCEIVLDDGGCIVIKSSFERLDSLIQKKTKQ